MTACDLHPVPPEERVRFRRANELARTILDRYGVDDAGIQLLRQGFVQVFRVVSPAAGEFVLRVYSARRPEQFARFGNAAALRSPDTLRSQLAWLSALGRETDLLVPEPVPMPDGSLVDSVPAGVLAPPRSPLRRLWSGLRGARDRRSTGWYGVLLRWVPGAHKGYDLAPEDLRLLGSYVARLHDHAERYRPPRGAVLPRWDWRWAFGETVPLWSEGEAYYAADEMEAFRAAARRVRGDLDRLGEGREAFGLIHRDLKLQNLVFDRGSVGAIDFDLCGWGYYLFDLGVVRRSLRTLTQRDADLLDPLWEAFLEGYGAKRPLIEDVERYLVTFDVMQSVAAVNRQLALLSSEATADQARPARFLENVASWLKDLAEQGGDDEPQRPPR